MADLKKSLRKMRTANANDLAFTNVASEDPAGIKESRVRAKSVGGSSGLPDTGVGVSIPLYATPRKSVSGTPHSPRSFTSSDVASPRASCDSRGSPAILENQEDNLVPLGPTMRHLVKLVQRLMAEYQFACAAKLLEQMTKEVMLTQILDTPVPAAWKLTSNLLEFAQTEREKYNGLMNNFVQNVTELVGSQSEVNGGNSGIDLGSNLLDKLEKRDNRAPKRRGKSVRKDDQAMPGNAKGTLSSALGLDSGSLGVQEYTPPDQNGVEVQKRRSEAASTAGRASLLGPNESPFFRSRALSHGGSFAMPDVQALQKMQKELTGMAPRESLSHRLGLGHMNNPPPLIETPTESSENRIRSSTNSEASMVEDDSSDFGPRESGCSRRSTKSAAQGADNPSRSPTLEAKAMSRTASVNSKLDQLPHFRGSAASAASVGLVNIIGSVDKPEAMAASTELELEVKDPLPSSFPNLSKDECRRCGNIFMCDANFCRKCGLERNAQAGSSNFSTVSKSNSLDSDQLPLNDKVDLKELSRGLQGLLSWRLQGNLVRSNSEDTGGKRRASSVTCHGSERRWSLDNAIRWKRSNSAPLPLKPSASSTPQRLKLPEAADRSSCGYMFGLASGSLSDMDRGQDPTLGEEWGDMRPNRPSEIKVTEPAESGFKETRFKILVPTTDNEHESESDSHSRSSSEHAAQKEVIFRPTGSIVGSGATIHAKSGGPQKVRRAKSMTGGIQDIFKENLEEDRAAYLSSPSHIFIVHPNSMFRMSWDVASLFIILFEAIILPLGLCFDMYPPDFVMWISTAFFTPDLALNLVTGFYHNGLLILRQKIILKRYLMGWFIIDFLSTVPWEAFGRSQGQQTQGQTGIILKFFKISKLMRVLRLLRVLKLKALIQRVEDMCSSYVVLVALSITKIVAFYMLVCHWTACMWGWLGADDPSRLPNEPRPDQCEPDGPCEFGIGIRGSPWRRRYGVVGEPAVQHYLVALQFATGLLTGAELQLMPGYWMERIFLTGMMIVSFLVCSMIISQIVVVMDKINQDNSEYLEHSRIIRDFMVSRGMPIKLQTKVKRYLEYQFKSRKVVHQNHDILFKLSPYLRMEIQEHMNKAILEHHPFFKGMDHSVLSQVCSLAQSVLYAPGDVVMRKGQIESLICFIVRGQLQIVEARKGVSIYIRAPAWTGDRGLFVATIRMHTVTCSMHSELLTICQQDLIDLVKSIPAAEEYIKDYCKRVIKNDPSTIFCHFCRGSRHDMDTCRELTEALRADKVGLSEVQTDEAWYQRAKNTITASKPKPPARKNTRDSRVLNAPTPQHITVQGKSVDPRASQVPATRNTTLAAAAYAAWEEQ